MNDSRIKGTTHEQGQGGTNGKIINNKTKNERQKNTRRSKTITGKNDKRTGKEWKKHQIGSCAKRTSCH